MRGEKRDNQMEKMSELSIEKQEEQERKQERQSVITTPRALPAPASDGFDEFNDDGFAPIIVFDATKPPPYWRDRSGNPFEGEWLAYDMKEEIVFWNNDGLIDRTKTITKQPGKRFPDVEDLNDAVDRSLWRDTQFGSQGPYQHQRVVLLLDPTTGGERRFISTSAGGAVCFRELAKSVQNSGERTAGT
jgi:hypothetical protein